MRIAIRADASSTIGAGHVMRCLTLANAFAKYGADVIFLCRASHGHLIKNINLHGFTVLKLTAITNQPTGSLLQYSQQQDAQECIDLLKNIKAFDLFIVDHYELDIEWQTLLHTFYYKLLVIDDLANRHHICDFLIDQTLGRVNNAYSELIPHHCQTLLGQEYMLLREEFTKQKVNILNKRLNKEDINHVLITMGGMDPHNITSKALNGLLSLKDQQPDLQVSVMLTSQAPHINMIIEVSEKHDWIYLYVDSSNIAKLMATADIAIGGSGSTAWERCCLALPTLSIIDADNQKLVDQSLANINACISLGWYESITEELIATQCQILFKDRIRYNELAIAAINVCDGRGTERVVDKVLAQIGHQTSQQAPFTELRVKPKKKEPITLEQATINDCQQVYQWQSKASIRKFFVTTNTPSYEEHVLWFNNTITSQRRHLFIIYDQQKALGSLRLDKKKENLYEISILIDSKNQGKGIGLLALKQLPQLINNATIIANVHIDNIYSHRLFIKAGFTRISLTSYFLNIGNNDVCPLKQHNKKDASV